MTTEIEKTFFDTFGIEQKEHKECQCDYLNCPNPDIEECEECYYYKTYKFDYPQITDRILLELICIANQYEDYSQTTNMKNIKARTLRILLRNEKFYRNFYENDKRYKKFKHQVRTLFEEG